SALYSLIISLVIIGLCVLAVINKQNVRDWWALRDYQAPASVTALADDIALTDKSRRIFYVNKPEITNSDRFIQACPSGLQEKTIVLGCYHGNQYGIYILDVTDPRLAGVEQVTAGHELLHAVYDRLSSSERKRIDKLLTDYYQTVTDKRIIDTIEAYKKSEPNDVVNEMHSIFGTEIPNLPAELEKYYAKHFKDRSVVISYSQKYQSEFTNRRNKIASDDAQLAIYKTQIDNLENELKQQASVIDARDAQMSQLSASGNYDAYNAMVAPFNNLVYSYNAKINTLQNLINRHNALVNERNSIVLEESQLINNLKPQAQRINN
ncbi:MAG: hypothetical protein EBX50_21180, partial [Chitinophagia bacterium]|nr:hypothetical protein [Chitinophagia bacterium]